LRRQMAGQRSNVGPSATDGGETTRPVWAGSFTNIGVRREPDRVFAPYRVRPPCDNLWESCCAQRAKAAVLLASGPGIGVRIPASQPTSVPGRRVAQHQDFQTLPRCKHHFPERNALLSARFGFSGRFAEQIRSAMNQYGRSDIFGHHFVFVGDTDARCELRFACSTSGPGPTVEFWLRLATARYHPGEQCHAKRRYNQAF
jgi:hypothetical protein